MERAKSGGLPNLPLQAVQISEAAIHAIVKHSLPEPSGNNIVIQPEEFAAFNNRIYAISCGQPPKKYILKVNGQHFDGVKAENEVGCLLLNETYCPSVPVPRVVAWSTGGRVVSRRHKDGTIIKKIVQELDVGVPGWILMTRVAGKPLDITKLTPAQKTSIIDQLVRITLCWRRNIPWSVWAGDIRFEPHHSKYSRYRPATRTSLPNLSIYGLQGMGKGRAPPMGTMLSYWQLNLRCLTDELESEQVLVPNREPLSSILHDCIENVLPRLSILKQNQTHEFVFTHADFGPHNVLVSDYYPSIITAVLDFEFCGFFPTWSQFFAYVTNDVLLNEEGNQNPDWPPDMYTKYVQSLAQQGVATPYGHEATREWKELANLMKMEMNIAPRWMMGAQKVEREALDKARTAVEVAVDRLRSLSQEDSRRP
ncbi:hypothetical protein M409DRAFT_25254 [Zasmidium cellare ATCC 36951]|uniref:Aminoglycoside phosphotransferase domain-containing protein n=1 Tax=Zasmidium cellare ATCC 36951 TaxID=1080233 RepID=A0A6A6CG35_ZASCE|nr:uncharacterized protein M409DRAFT_25254 [Zasmidium cellare ATCC 36951]KAF2164376.1 hypothetical protein M409DRAFT_25254 [Zasmidium cellare ATCC 36951]